MLPLVAVSLEAPFYFGEAVSFTSCWLNVESGALRAVYVPVAGLAAVAAVVWEAAASFRGRPLPFVDPQQRLTSLSLPIPPPSPRQEAGVGRRVNLEGLPVLLGLYLVSHGLGVFAVFHQKIELYGIVCILNWALGGFLAFFHTLADHQARPLSSSHSHPTPSRLRSVASCSEPGPSSEADRFRVTQTSCMFSKWVQ